MKKLLIVESPAKAKTIGKYLGGDFEVKSSVGHVRDLPKKSGAIKIVEDKKNPGTWTFTPSYEISPDKKKVVEDLRRAAKSASEIYLAPDPDREGEAIAWHLQQILADVAKSKPVHRVTYNEITRDAVLSAVENPGKIDTARVDAQQARRILDRIVGYKVSPLLWKYLSYGYSLSAGRVQSVALRLIVEREREIAAFKPVAYWILGVEAKKNSGSQAFIAKLSRLDGAKPEISSQEQSTTLVDDLDGAELSVSDVKMTPKTRRPYPPFTTSTLQQAASSVCGFSPHRTMSLAQHLYEAGLITYMRTDSVNVAAVARGAAKKLIEDEFGSDFAPTSPRVYKSKAGAQEAHEAVRPTDVTKRPGTLGLDSAANKLYDLIWRRFMASQMADARLMLRTVALGIRKPGLRHDYTFTASATSVDFEGFLRVMKVPLVEKKENEDGDEIASIPPLAVGDCLTPVRWLSDKHETKAPPHYSEAALVKALEENGVGRPSTYASTIETLVTRQYAKREARQLIPTQRGTDVNDWLVKKLDSLFAVGYTAEMEGELDKVEAGKEKCDEMLSDFYKKFLAWMDAAKEPPPPREKFDQLFAMLDQVKEWQAPVAAAEGRRVYDDHGFVESVKKQIETGKPQVSDKQLSALVKLAVKYRAQIPDGENRLVDLGYGPEIDREKTAPSAELVKWCFLTIDRIGGLQKNPFLNSLREQVDRGRLLSAKQFAILARSIGENAGALDDAEHVRARLAPYVPGGFEIAPSDPAVPGLLRMLSEVKEWKEPSRRGRRVYNDSEFYTSLRDQYNRRSSLSPRQVVALRRVCVNYRDQIPNFETRAAALGLDKLQATPARENSNDVKLAEAAAKADAAREKKVKIARAGGKKGVRRS